MKIIINSSSMVPIYEQIMDQIKSLITGGDLKQNDASSFSPNSCKRVEDQCADCKESV